MHPACLIANPNNMCLRLERNKRDGKDATLAQEWGHPLAHLLRYSGGTVL